MTSIEVEVRGILTESVFYRVEHYLKENSHKNWEDNRETTFFIIPNTSFKIVKNVTKDKAKIYYKSTSDESEVEIKLPINADEVHNAVKLFKNLGFDKSFNDTQKTVEFEYKNVQTSLIKNEKLGFYFEMITLVDNEDEVPDGMNRIDSLCEELQISYMTDKEIEEHLKK